VELALGARAMDRGIDGESGEIRDLTNDVYGHE
jgi:hypothetical protein